MVEPIFQPQDDRVGRIGLGPHSARSARASEACDNVPQVPGTSGCPARPPPDHAAMWAKRKQKRVPSTRPYALRDAGLGVFAELERVVRQGLGVHYTPVRGPRGMRAPGAPARRGEGARARLPHQEHHDLQIRFLGSQAIRAQKRNHDTLAAVQWRKRWEVIYVDSASSNRCVVLEVDGQGTGFLALAFTLNPGVDRPFLRAPLGT